MKAHIVQCYSTDQQQMFKDIMQEIEQLYKCFSQYTVLALAIGN